MGPGQGHVKVGVHLCSPRRPFDRLPAPAPPPDSGVDYLALLRLERQRLLQGQLEGIHFSRLTAAPAQPQEQDRADPVD